MKASGHKDRLAGMRCLIESAVGSPVFCEGRIELHHVAEGSGLRNDWALVPLCTEHHRGKTGLHGMGTKAFCAKYRPPGDCEYGLLVWLIEALAKQRVTA